MATILDVGLLGFLMPLFIFLFIFVVVYSILSKTSMFGEKQVALNFIAALCVAAISVFTGTITGLVSIVTPWIVFIFLMLVLIFSIFRFLNVEDKEIWSTIGSQTLVYVVILIIILIGLSIAFESQVTPTPGKSIRNEVIGSLTHPRLLGALFILIIASFTVRLLADKLEK